MKKDIALDVTKVTELSAIEAFKWIGKGNKNSADSAAVNAMRDVLNSMDILGEVVIGEGEIDDAPMLYCGEIVGNGSVEVDIAVDPIDGTRMVAVGQDNAVSVILVAKRNSLLKAPDMYMEKIMVNQKGKGSIDIDLSIEENINNLAKKLNKSVGDLTVMTLAKERHNGVIEKLQGMGVRTIAIPDGDVALSVLVAMPNSDIDMFYGIGGAPEGVISAAIMKLIDGDMQAKLLTRDVVKGYAEDNIKFSNIEKERCEELGININKKLELEDLISSNAAIVSITGITDGNLVKGVTQKDDFFETETLLIKSETIRKIKALHMK